MNDEILEKLIGGALLGLGTLTIYFGISRHHYKKIAEEREELLNESLEQTEIMTELYTELVETIDPEWGKQVRKDIKKLGFTVLNKNEES